MDLSLNLEVDHITYTTKKLHSEKNNSRLWYMIKFHPITDYQFHMVEELSMYWYYHKLYNCGYSAHIMKKINFY